jgi:hypothetical protein
MATKTDPVRARAPRQFRLIEGDSVRHVDAESVIPGVVVATNEDDTARAILYRTGKHYFRKTILADDRAALHAFERLMDQGTHQWINEKEVHRLRLAVAEATL